jgi:DNA-binding Xre family transcriptional regulator
MEKTLRQMIVEAGLKQTDLASHFGIADSFVSKMVRREQSIPVELIKPMAALLKVSTDDLLDIAPRLPRPEGAA